MFDTEQTACITPVVVATRGQGQTLAAGIHFALSAGGRHFAHMFMNATAVPNYVVGLQVRPTTRSATEGPAPGRVKRTANFVEKP